MFGATDFFVKISGDTMTGALGIGGAAPAGTMLNVEGGGVLFQGATGGIPVTGAGTRFMWIPSDYAFRAGRVTGTQWDTIGDYSFAFGLDASAPFNYSIALGTYCEAGLYSTAVGFSNDGTGLYASVFGFDNAATGTDSSAVGDSCNATDTYAAAHGTYCDAGFYGAAFGVYANSSGSQASTSGVYVTASNDNSVAHGQFLTASGEKASVYGIGVDSTNRLDNTVDGELWLGNNSTFPAIRITDGGGIGGVSHVRLPHDDQELRFGASSSAAVLWNSAETALEINTAGALLIPQLLKMPAGGQWAYDGVIFLRVNRSDNNFHFGVDSGNDTLTGTRNFTLGRRTGFSLTTGYDNTFIGDDAGDLTTTGYQNTFLGASAGGKNTTGFRGTFIGFGTGASNTEGFRNTFIGNWAGFRMETGDDNLALGYQAMYFNVTGSRNSVFGRRAGYGSSGNSYSNNVLFGFQAGYSLTTGSNNILIGHYPGDQITTGSYNIIIGNQAAAPSATGNYQMNIGNLLYSEGIDGTGTSVSTGGLGVGVQSPDERLHIDGNLKIGTGKVGVDYQLIFDGDNNDGILTWMEGEDYFHFEDEVLIQDRDPIRYALMGA